MTSALRQALMRLQIGNGLIPDAVLDKNGRAQALGGRVGPGLPTRLPGSGLETIQSLAQRVSPQGGI